MKAAKTQTVNREKRKKLRQRLTKVVENEKKKFVARGPVAV